MITIPILLNFDQDKVIGQLTIDENQLPPTPEFLFSIGYSVEGYEDNKVTKYKLMCANLTMDDIYFKFLLKENESRSI